MNMMIGRNVTQDYDFPGSMIAAKQGVVAIVSDNEAVIECLAPVCDFLDLKIEIISNSMDVGAILRETRPMAVIADVDGGDQDGFHTLKLVARYNRDLPVMLLTGGDPALMGAADAVQELWGLSAVTSTSEFPVAGQLVAFLFSAGRRAGCMRLVPV